MFYLKRIVPVLLMSLVVFATGVALAAETISSEVIVILAKKDKGEIDPSLKDIKALKRPPFNTFRSMKVLSRTETEITVGKSEKKKLPNGRVLRYEVERKMPNGRYQVKVSIKAPKKPDYLPLATVAAAPGDPFFVAGQAHEGGTLVIGIVIGK